MALANRLQERLRLLAEHCEQHQVLLARGQPVGGVEHVLGARRILFEGWCAGRQQPDGTLDSRLDRRRSLAVPAFDEQPELVQHGAVAPRREDVQQRLGGENLPDRCRKRRPARLGADAADLRERVEQTVSRRVGAQVHVERRHEACREVVLGGADGDAGRDRRHGLVADVLVDRIGCLPERVCGDARVAPEAVEHVDERFAGDAVKCERQRVDRRGDEVGADARGDERVRETRARGALQVEPDG